MKINVTNILLFLLLVILGWQNFVKQDVLPPKERIIKLPEIKGTTGKKTITEIVYDTVYLPSEERIVVDSTFKAKYEQAEKDNDSLKKRTLFLEAIKINKYEKLLVDNDTVRIKGYVTTRGELLDYSVDYRIEPPDFTYSPEIVKKRPSLSMGFGVEAGVPIIPTTNFLIKGDVYFENSKGNGFNLGYDTQQRVWLGVRKTFTLKK
jgi:hypothetical protein